jgi:hypothetical protein
MATNAYQVATRHLEAALALTGESDPRRSAVLLDLARSRWGAGDAEESLLVQARDAQLAAGRWDGAAWAEYLLGFWAEDVAGDGERADDHYAAAEGYAQQVPYTELTSAITYAQMFRLTITGRAGAAAEHARSRAADAGGERRGGR